MLSSLYCDESCHSQVCSSPRQQRQTAGTEAGMGGQSGQQSRPRNMIPISIWNNDSKRMDRVANYLTLPPANLIPWTC